MELKIVNSKCKLQKDPTKNREAPPGHIRRNVLRYKIIRLDFKLFMADDYKGLSETEKIIGSPLLEPIINRERERSKA